MLQIFDYVFEQFASYSEINLYLELIAVFFGLISVWFAKNNNVLVYPTGIISTLIFVYLLFKENLLGDMLINGYYFIMSIYGWYIWNQKNGDENRYKISYISSSEKLLSYLLFIISMVFIILVYLIGNGFLSTIALIDSLTTAVFFVGMWMMAKRKIENWYLWIIGDLISIPLYFYKGMLFTSIQYLIFTIIAFYGLQSWRKMYSINLNKPINDQIK